MSETYKLDCSGLVYPQPVAKTKRLLNQMNSGEILEVKGDFSEAGKNIKLFIEKKGENVLKYEMEGEYYYLKIQKK